MKVGDRVTISSSGRAFQIAAISGESKRQWKIGDYWRFDKEHLRLQVPGTGIVYTIKPATQEDHLQDRVYVKIPLMVHVHGCLMDFHNKYNNVFLLS